MPGSGDCKAYLRNLAGLLSDHHNKASVSKKQTIIFVLVESFAYNV